MEDETNQEKYINDPPVIFNENTVVDFNRTVLIRSDFDLNTQQLIETIARALTMKYSVFLYTDQFDSYSDRIQELMKLAGQHKSSLTEHPHFVFHENPDWIHGYHKGQSIDPNNKTVVIWDHSDYGFDKDTNKIHNHRVPHEIKSLRNEQLSDLQKLSDDQNSNFTIVFHEYNEPLNKEPISPESKEFF